MAMGVPRVMPCSVPDWISIRSFSSRGVESADWPGRRRVSCGWMSDSVRRRPGGQPSTMTVTEGQWDSPALWRGVSWGGWRSLGDGRGNAEMRAEGGHGGSDGGEASSKALG